MNCKRTAIAVVRANIQQDRRKKRDFRPAKATQSIKARRAVNLSDIIAIYLAHGSFRKKRSRKGYLYHMDDYSTE